MFYGMERFSEDMDFSLLEPNSSFDFESYFPAIKEEFAPEIDLSSREALIAAFRKRIATIDFKAASEDVRPFLKDASCLDIWSQEYFNSLVDMIKVEL